jgi:hypothetical protein
VPSSSHRPRRQTLEYIAEELGPPAPNHANRDVPLEKKIAIADEE